DWHPALTSHDLIINVPDAGKVAIAFGFEPRTRMWFRDIYPSADSSHGCQFAVVMHVKTWDRRQGCEVVIQESKRQWLPAANLMQALALAAEESGRLRRLQDEVRHRNNLAARAPADGQINPVENQLGKDLLGALRSYVDHRIEDRGRKA